MMITIDTCPVSPVPNAALPPTPTPALTPPPALPPDLAPAERPAPSPLHSPRTIHTNTRFWKVKRALLRRPLCTWPSPPCPALALLLTYFDATRSVYVALPSGTSAAAAPAVQTPMEAPAVVPQAPQVAQQVAPQVYGSLSGAPVEKKAKGTKRKAEKQEFSEDDFVVPTLDAADFHEFVSDFLVGGQKTARQISSHVPRDAPLLDAGGSTISVLHRGAAPDMVSSAQRPPAPLRIPLRRRRTPPRLCLSEFIFYFRWLTRREHYFYSALPPGPRAQHRHQPAQGRVHG